ncbi:MAG: PIN domain-containing protein [Pseudanabaena sp.]|jgi:predicted nucleic acid-binding protein
MSKTLVLDTNILIRALLGEKVPSFLNKYVNSCDFITPDNCYQELYSNLPKILQNQNLGVSISPFSEEILQLQEAIIPISEEFYIQYKNEALRRIKKRDPNDWEVVALAMHFNCPIWTEDKDFFGIGIATWNSQNVEIYLGS